MTTEIDWDNAPERADYYANGKFRFDSNLFCEGKWFDSPWMQHECKERYDDYQERPQPKPAAKHPTTSTEYLAACAKVQLERAKQYNASGTGERSFEAAAEAFNCVTGKNLRGSDVCLILEMVKLVRQYSDPTRLHDDSVLDAVSYLSLWAEELTKELR